MTTRTLLTKQKQPTMKRTGLATVFALAAAFLVGGCASNAPRIGSLALDGTVYAGRNMIFQALHTTASDAPGSAYNFDTAKAYCAASAEGGHKDWHVPTADQLLVLYDNKNTGALKGTFNETGLYPAGWYWSSSQDIDHNLASAQRFSDGNGANYGKDFASSLRCVR
jgi:Protein of unknown function (DUF1566)